MYIYTCICISVVELFVSFMHNCAHVVILKRDMKLNEGSVTKYYYTFTDFTQVAMCLIIGLLSWQKSSVAYICYKLQE